MIVETDDRGRIYVEKALRERYGERFHVVSYRDRLALVLIDDDPLVGLRSAVGDALEGYSTEELRDIARNEARQRVGEHVRWDRLPPRAGEGGRLAS